MQQSNKNLRNTFLNSHDYLNFVKNKNKISQSKPVQKASPIKMQFHNADSIFKAKPKQPLKNQIHNHKQKIQQKSQQLSQEKVLALLKLKNQEIRKSMSMEKQGISEMFYKDSNFKSMQYQRDVKKTQKMKIKVKLPHVPNHTKEISQRQDSKRPSLIDSYLPQYQSSSQPTINSSKQLRNQPKRNLSFYKKRKSNNQFGIQIRSINQCLLDNMKQYKDSLELRKDVFSLDSDQLMKVTSHSKQHTIHQQYLNTPYVFPKIKQALSHHEQVVGPTLTNFNKQISAMSLYEDLNQPIIDLIQPVNELNQQIQQNNKDKKQKNKHHLTLLRRDKKQAQKALYYSQRELTVYDHKITKYRQYLLMLNMVHLRYDPLVFKQAGSLKNQEKYRYYIGPGNNGLLVKSLMRRRFWWVQEEDYRKAHLVWTQLKINQYFQLQNKHQISLQKIVSDKQILSYIEVNKKKKQKNIHVEQKNIQRVAFRPPLPADRDKIMTITDKQIYQNLQDAVNSGSKDRFGDMIAKLKQMGNGVFKAAKEEKDQLKMHNHLSHNHFIGNKKALFYNLKHYYQLLKKDVFQIIPLTFHIKNGQMDPSYDAFLREFKLIQKANHKKKSEKKGNVWIVKPGQLSNRGNGIVVINSLNQLHNIFKKKEKHSDGMDKTYIVQKYIQKPLLYKGRKFDIRHYMLITRMHGVMRAYWFGQGYIRTSSYRYDIQDIGDEMIHLTNDAIQKNCTFYGKHEDGNKLSYAEFQKYIDHKFGEDKCSIMLDIYPRMKQIATDAVKSTYLQLDPRNLEHNFQVFGLDFMIDEDFRVWLIQVNTNPCLQISSKLLGRIIPSMVEHSMRLSIDLIFPPPTHFPNSQKYMVPDNPLGHLLYQLIFDQTRDGLQLNELYGGSNCKIDYGGEIGQDNQVYENDGKEIQLAPQLA